MTQRESYAAALGQDWADGLDALPEHMIGGVVRYVLHGVPAGNFLAAVIRGDLFGALRGADDINKNMLPAYANFFWNHAPSICFGSEQAYDDWVKAGGVMGLRTKEDAK